MTNITCLMITTNLPHRFDLQRRAMQSVDDGGKGLFDRKILSVDLMEGHPFNVGDEPWKTYKDLGWTVVSGHCSGYRAMANNQLRGLGFVETDYMVYCEDHMKIDRLPLSPESFIGCLTTPTPQRDLPMGFACFNGHIIDGTPVNDNGKIIHHAVPDHGVRLGFINTAPNYWGYNENTFLIKGPQIRDDYYLNFPVAMVHTELFSTLLAHCMAMYSGVGIEVGYTRAWFDRGLDERYEVGVYTQTHVSTQLPMTFTDFHYRATCRYRNNDPASWHPSVAKHDCLPENRDQWNHFF